MSLPTNQERDELSTIVRLVTDVIYAENSLRALIEIRIIKQNIISNLEHSSYVKRCGVAVCDLFLTHLESLFAAAYPPVANVAC